jgi:HTH-type transcriptional regulator/antitoxin HipB
MARTRLRTPEDLGAAIRDARIEQSLTQAQLARDAGVSREWLIGIEQGHRPRAELTKILSVLDTLGLPLYAGTPPEPHGRESPPGNTAPGESITELATRQAIETYRPSPQIPAADERDSMASHLLNAGIDPVLTAYLTRTSRDWAPRRSLETPWTTRISAPREASEH